MFCIFRTCSGIHKRSCLRSKVWSASLNITIKVWILVIKPADTVSIPRWVKPWMCHVLIWHEAPPCDLLASSTTSLISNPHSACTMADWWPLSPNQPWQPPSHFIPHGWWRCLRERTLVPSQYSPMLSRSRWSFLNFFIYLFLILLASLGNRRAPAAACTWDAAEQRTNLLRVEGLAWLDSRKLQTTAALPQN